MHFQLNTKHLLVFKVFFEIFLCTIMGHSSDSIIKCVNTVLLGDITTTYHKKFTHFIHPYLYM